MHKNKIAKRVPAALGALVLAAAVLLGCCGSFITTGALFVADWNNNRVLEYSAPLSTGESASVVLGQANSTTTTRGATEATTMAGPNAVAMDAAGNLYVSDAFHCRVLQFTPPFTTGMSATLAVGEPSGANNLTTSDCALTATGLGNTFALTVDSNGNLWVSDTFSNRILKYPAPITAGETATVVLGQTTFTANLCNQELEAPTAATLCDPGGLAFDSAGDLWAIDTGNNRVLMYPAANLVTGGSATVVLGQPGFGTRTANNGGISASSLSFEFAITGLAFDSTGNLWVTDQANNRVLMYPKASLATNGAAATVVLGQTTSTANLCNQDLEAPTAATLCAPVGLAFDKQGNLAVSDGHNSRILGFTPPFTTGMSATLVLGQANLTTGTENTGGVGAATLDQPGGLATSF